MQTILGATGQIGIELARELRRLNPAGDLRLVSRNPRRVSDADHVVSANLLNAVATLDAVRGSNVVYFAAGLPPVTHQWETQFPVMLANTIAACRAAGAAFAYFDNTYMYPQDSRLLTEETPFAPNGRKARVRAAMANTVLHEMRRADIPVLIARAPEFYGPGRTQSVTNSLVIWAMLKGRRARVPVRDDVRRSFIWTPDASRAFALLGNTPSAFGQTWHLPCCDDRLTYKQFVPMAAEVFGASAEYDVMRMWSLRLSGLFSPRVRELGELLPRYAQDNLFDSGKFKAAFPDFVVSDYRRGLELIREDFTNRATRQG
ncbi:MAG: NAD-dependent epimerase/dehydratase family protein [Gemmatimonas sp.]